MAPGASRPATPLVPAAPRRALPDEQRRWRDLANSAVAVVLLRGRGVAVLVRQEQLTWESDILGIPRSHMDLAVVPEGAVAVSAIARRINTLADPTRHVSLRLSARAGGLAWELQAVGWKWADLSVEYVFREPPPEGTDRWQLTAAQPAEVDDLAAALGRTLADGAVIRTRFTTDALLRPRAAALYEAWAVRGLQPVANRHALVARSDSGRALGVITASAPHEGAGGCGRIELNAVFPGVRSQGVYTAMSRQMIRALFAAGVAEVRVRTSGSTLGAQRVWQRLGGVPDLADLVLHRHPTVVAQSDLSLPG